MSASLTLMGFIHQRLPEFVLKFVLEKGHKKGLHHIHNLQNCSHLSALKCVDSVLTEEQTSNEKTLVNVRIFVKSA